MLGFDEPSNAPEWVPVEPDVDEALAECTELSDKITAMGTLIKTSMTLGSTSPLEEALEIAQSIEEK